MRKNTFQEQLFSQRAIVEQGTVRINSRCRFQVQNGYCVISVCGMPLAHYMHGDRMAEAHAMITLVDLGWAQQIEVARAFGCSERTVRRNQRRFNSSGLAALGRVRGYPKGRPRVSSSREGLVITWKSEGVSQREIARRLGINEKAVRKLLRRLGWKNITQEQISFIEGMEGADPKLSASTSRKDSHPPASSPEIGQFTEIVTENGADPKLSGSEEVTTLPTMASFDPDPTNRQVDRILAYKGLLDDAAPLFHTATQVSSAGVLLAIPVLVDSGVFEIARDIYSSIGPAFYGLRTTVVTLLLMALLRIKRPEGLKEYAPQILGRLLGLDRAPEVKTLRRKLIRMAAYGRAADFGRALARQRVATRGYAMGFLYVDGHVRAYHGKRSLPKTHLARMRLSMPATTDYWINDQAGDPLFVVTTEANKGLVKMLPPILDEIRSLVGDRRVTVVFDRGGWSPKLFANLISSGFDILTYRKGRYRRVPRKLFSTHDTIIEGRKISYQLADQNISLFYGVRPRRKRLRLRQVTRLSEDGHQTPIITSRTDLSTIEIAYRMFDRWRQENFFKYMREEFALDALVDYGVEAADANRDVPNPRHKELTAKLRKAIAELDQLVAHYGAEAFINVESMRRTMRGFKIANAPINRQILDSMKLVADLEKKRAAVPKRVPVKQITQGEVVKLSVERKHITDLLKMVAYQAEGDLLRIINPHYKRAEDEGRTLIQNVLSTQGDIEVTQNELRVTLEPLSSPHRTYALIALCEQLNKTRTIFPGSKLRLYFNVKTAPNTSLAFPGPRSNRAVDGPQPDNSVGV